MMGWKRSFLFGSRLNNVELNKNSGDIIKNKQ